MERAITALHTVPSLAGAWLGGAAPELSAETLRWVFFAGEPLLGPVVERWRAVFPRTGVVNLYGPTETTLVKCFYPVPDPAGPRVQPIGAPLPQTQALVLAGVDGRHDLLCGIGEVGEIVLRTPFRSLGYLNRAEETQLRFRPNPFRRDAGDLLYYTGDRGRYRLDGTLEILGRLDAQVKVRGVRIEPGEIQGCLGRHEAVAESAVLLREFHPGDHRLVAYVVLRPGAVFDPEALRRHLRLELPEVMIPAAFVALPALPLTPNGKLDARSLPVPESSDGGQRALHGPVEEIAAGLFAELLGLAHVGPDDNFFELGGHSLIGAQLISRLRQALAVDLPLRAIFEAPTVAGLAVEIERLRCGAGGELPTIASFHQERSSPPPLSFAQERYWAGRHLEALSVSSTIPMLMHLTGPLDRRALTQALAAIVDRHELLRTSFREGPEGPIQVIHPALPVALPEVDLERLGAAERMEEVRRFSILEGRLHFDYERPPLFRQTLFRCAPFEHVLLFTIHHVASDWWSNTILVREVSALYFAFATGRPSPLPPLAAQFQDFARWQRRLSLEEEQASQVAFWREHLAGAVPIDLTAGRPRPEKRTFAAGTEEVWVPAELERQLDALAAREGVTLFMTLLAAFVALLHAETGQDDLVVPCSFANRNQLETEALLGNFATALPLRARLSGVRTFRQLLGRVRDVTLLAHDHPDIFWEPVVEGASFLEEGDRGGLTTFRILFQLVKVAPPTPPAPHPESALRIAQLPVDTGKIRLDLSLFLSQAGRLAGRFRYNRDVLDERRVSAMRDRFVRILAAVVADPEHPLSGLPPAAAVPEELGTGELALAMPWRYAAEEEG